MPAPPFGVLGRRDVQDRGLVRRESFLPEFDVRGERCVEGGRHDGVRLWSGGGASPTEKRVSEGEGTEMLGRGCRHRSLALVLVY